MASRPLEPIVPTPEEKQMAGHASKRLARVVHPGRRARLHEVTGKSGEGAESVEIPASAVPLIQRVLAEMAKGNAVAVIPIHMELTTQQAADLLGVSRPFVVKLLESGELPFRKVGSHRRVLFKDAMEYRERISAAGQRALDELSQLSQELDIPG